MKKILLSLVVVSALVAAVAIGTQALFSDTETSTGNTFTTGTIDIAVDNQNPWESSQQYSLLDMKPSYTEYIEFWVENVGTNPANLWKRLDGTEYTDLETSEPECDAEGGDWVEDECVNREEEDHNLSPYINYDMRVELYNIEEELVWWETIYMDEDNVKLSDIMANEDGTYLGMIPVGWRMRVIQSYHMVDVEGVDMNKYQGDGMTFNIELYAEQLTNTIRLVKKFEANTDLAHHVWNEGYADFAYKVKDDALRWTLDTTDVSDGDYTLIAWDNSTHGYTWDWDDVGEAIVIGKVTVSGNDIYNGEIDLDDDLINAKIWLVPGTFGTVGSPAGSVPWNATGTYFETGLVDYYDSL